MLMTPIKETETTLCCILPILQNEVNSSALGDIVPCRGQRWCLSDYRDRLISWCGLALVSARARLVKEGLLLSSHELFVAAWCGLIVQLTDKAE